MQAVRDGELLEPLRAGALDVDAVRPGRDPDVPVLVGRSSHHVPRRQPTGRERPALAVLDGHDIARCPHHGPGVRAPVDAAVAGVLTRIGTTVIARIGSSVVAGVDPRIRGWQDFAGAAAAPAGNRHRYDRRRRQQAKRPTHGSSPGSAAEQGACQRPHGSVGEALGNAVLTGDDAAGACRSAAIQSEKGGGAGPPVQSREGAPVKHRGPSTSRRSPQPLLFNPAMDAEACYRAIEGRDGRFAGRFFLGVRTTHVYCRPGCPARLPRRENVILFQSAAAAQAAGFRACLRCRPDAAPGSPAQAGTAATLSRALRLLEESGEAAGLADRLGITDRHLRRLFARHLGASPAEVLRTRRLHLARQLLENSPLRIIDVAHASGFHSLRRFNEAVRRGFGRTPSQLRTRPAEAGAELSLKLPFHPPLDFEALLAFFAQRALPGVEEVDGGAWRRRLPEGWLQVRRAGPAHLEARMPAALAPRALQIAARIQRVFDLRADPRAIVEHLSADAALKPFLRS